MGSIIWDAEVAGVYDETYAAMFDPAALGPVTACWPSWPGAGPRWSSRPGPGGWRWR